MDTPEANSPTSERACSLCRQRRVKCDRRQPGCDRCSKFGRTCPGYESDRKFLDEGIKVRRKYDGQNHAAPSPSTNASAGQTPRANVSTEQPSPHRPWRSPRDGFSPRAVGSPTAPNTASPYSPPSSHPLSRTPLTHVQFPAVGTPHFSGPGQDMMMNPSLWPPTQDQYPAVSRDSTQLPSLNFPPSTQFGPDPVLHPHAGDIHYTQEHPTARLLEGRSEYAPSEMDSTVSDDYFDLDIEEYYAKGNNACGFIPGLPVILTDQMEPEADDDLLTSDFASLSGRSSRYGSVAGDDRRRPEYSQRYLQERATELACLTRHFVQSVSPAMDLFDLDTYFSRIVPLKAVQNVMLRSAMAAVAANQIGQLVANKSPTEGLQHLLPLMGGHTALGHRDWFYKAANYYDRGISYLRTFLQRWLADVDGDSAHASYGDPTKAVPDMTRPQSHSAVPLRKRRRVSDSPPSNGSDMEALVAAISVFSLYDSLDNPSDGWSQHLDGFKALLQAKILPQAVSAPRPRIDPFISMKAGRAAFWNFARADYLAAYLNQSRTRLDPDNLTMWKAAGLPVMDDGTLTYTDTSTPNSAVVSYQPGDREDLVSCTLIWIVLRVMNFITPGERSTTETAPPVDESQTPTGAASAASAFRTRSLRWKHLRRQLEDWHENLPFTFQPYAIMGAGTSQHSVDQQSAETARPRFTRLFFSVPMCAAALQLYHFAQILLLLNQPVDDADARNLASRIRMFRKVSAESEHHSRRICGVALGKPPPAVLRQMVHPLYLAGLCFEEKEDRLVVVDLLRNIELETGCSTKRRVLDLREQWGWERSAHGTEHV